MKGFNYRFYLTVLDYNFVLKHVEMAETLAYGNLKFTRGGPKLVRLNEKGEGKIEYVFKDDLGWNQALNKIRLRQKNKLWLRMVQENIVTREFE